MKNNYVVGLDIGTTKIACFVGERGEKGKLKIVGFGKSESLGVQRGIVVNILDVAESIKRAVAQAAEQIGEDIDKVYVGVAGQHIKSFQSSDSISIPREHEFITQEDVNNLTKQQYNLMLSPGEKIIHVFPQVYKVDGEELTDCTPVGVVGNRLECVFHVVTGFDRHLQDIVQSVRMAGLEVIDLVLEPIASAYAVLDDNDLEAGVALVDIGGGTTDIAIFKDGIIRHTAVLPLAGNVITNDIRETCVVLKNQAESLKVRFGSCMPSQVSEDDYISIPPFRNQPAREVGMRTLATVIKQRTETILEQVAYELQLSGLDKRLIGGLVLTGGGAKLLHIKEFAEYITATDTRIGLPDEHMEPSTAKELIHPMYSTGIGLVLYGMKKEAFVEQPKAEEKPVEDEIAPLPPINEPVAEEPETPEPEREERTERKKKTWAAIGSFFKKIIQEDQSMPEE